MNLFSGIADNNLPDIAGLAYLPSFIAHDEERALLSAIDGEGWLTELRRRVQHYGYRYDYRAREVAREAYLGPLPHWLQPLAHRLAREKIFPEAPDQAIVNEYLPGQGIAAHVDCVPCFGDVIASLSLGSPAVMQFSNPRTGERRDVPLQERSLAVLSGPARYEWLHAIPARKSDRVGGIKTERGRRVSVTFRMVITGNF